MDLSYILNELGEERQQYYNAVVPPIMQSSNFAFNTVADLAAALPHEKEYPFYTRGNNPTVAILKKKVAALEHAEDALIFGSGCAAIASAVISVLKAGDHVICVRNPYGWTNHLLNVLLKRYGVTTTMVDGRTVENFENALQDNTRLIFLESPNSWTFELQDLKAVADLAKSKDIVTIIDNSYTSPLYQRPIDLGIDLVVHTASKYLGGHSDIVAGVACGSKELIEKMFATEYLTLGGIISPNDAWLMLRSLRTLPIRLDRINQSTHKVVDYLVDHPKVEQVIFPHHNSHPQYELAKQQMSGCGGLFSLQLKTESTAAIDTFCDSLDRFLIACSWGGHESLILPAHIFFKDPKHYDPDIPENMVRLYIGLEEPEVIITDLEQALENI